MKLIQIAAFLIETVFGFFVFLVLLRFLLQSLRAPFHNPIGQFTIALTDWIVRPLRGIIPPFRRQDLASLVAAWLLILVKILLLMLLLGMPILIGNLLMLSGIDLLRDMLRLIMLVVIVQIVVSWINPQNPLSFVLNALTRPFYRLFRFVPPVGQFDLSPLFVLLAINILLILLPDFRGL